MLSCVPLFAPYHTPHGLQLARLPCPLPFPSDPMDYRVHGILQASILEWVAFPFSRGSSQPRDRTQVSRTAGGFFTTWAIRDTTITRSLLKLMSIESVMLSNHLILCLQSFSAPGSFLTSWLFASGDQSIGALASASVLPVNIQDWFPLGWTGWISLQSKGLSRVFSKPQFKSISSSVLRLSYGTTFTSIHDYWKNRSFD